MGLPLSELDVSGEQKSVWNILANATTHVFSSMEFVGEKIADALGVNTPRYHLFLNDLETYVGYAI